LAWDDIDCLVVASATMDQALPYNAAMLHAELGLSGQRTTTFDIGASCMSFLTALDVCSTLVEAGRFHRVMIASADISTFTTDRADLRTNGIFGDGAAACIIEKTADNDSSAILASASITLSEGIDACQIRSGGSRFHRRVPQSNAEALFEMNPRVLYALVAREMPDFVDRLLASAGLRKKDIDLMIPHQASHLALKHIVRLLGFRRERTVDIFATHGNQVSASLPTALHHGLTETGLPRGSQILLLGSGAGVTIGGVVLTY
jgi:3-oxoacyl-[acyl-carrier-protein] synthase-3